MLALRQFPQLLTPRRIRKSTIGSGSSGPESLRAALLDGSLATHPAFGKKSETKLLTELDRIAPMRGLTPYPRAVRLGEDVLDTIRHLGGDTCLSGGVARAEELAREIIVVS